MKRFLLSLLIVPLLLIGGFSNAYVWFSWYKYLWEFWTSPNWNNGVSVDYNFTPWYYKFEYVPVNSFCSVWSSSVVAFYQFRGCNWWDWNCFTTSVDNPSNPFNVSIDRDYTSIRVWYNWWGNCRNSILKIYKYYETTLYDDWLIPVILSVFDVTTEFIPYVVYIWIWTLLVTLWFIAVKWLVNWLVRKITVIFKSKRG